MSVVAILSISVALAMDAFAVSVASGITIRHLRIKHALTIATWFGAFQAVMPWLGWLAGMKMKPLLQGVDHWIAFGLLCFVGGKMIYESVTIQEVEKKTDPMDVGVLFLLSVATSIDALAAGLSFALLAVSIVAPVIAIGLITFVMSFFGVWLGDRFGHFFERKIEVAGGVILIVIGFKVLITHLLSV